MSVLLVTVPHHKHSDSLFQKTHICVQSLHTAVEHSKGRHAFTEMIASSMSRK